MSELDMYQTVSEQTCTPVTRLISHPTTPHFPEEIVTDILGRLPVKTLIRFKCVSKSFLYLILNPHFINTHLVKSSHINDKAYPNLILGQSFGQYVNYLNSSSLQSLFNSQSGRKNDYNYFMDHIIELEYPLKNYGCEVCVVGSCNGLVCMYSGKQSIFILNPSTRETKELPYLGMCLWFDRKLTFFGFGYDHVNDDYKVVVIKPWVKWRQTANRVFVYSLRTNSWGQNGNFPHALSDRYLPYQSDGTFVNGVLHWMIETILKSTIIVSFDLGNETYREIAQPIIGDGCINLHLTVLEGFLCISCALHCSRTDIWIMKEYGIRDSWFKLCTITTDPVHNTQVAYPVSISMTGEILLKCDRSLIVCNPFRYHEIYKLSECIGDVNVTTHIESLVSPSIYEEREKQVLDKYTKVEQSTERLEKEKKYELKVSRLEEDNKRFLNKIAEYDEKEKRAMAKYEKLADYNKKLERELEIAKKRIEDNELLFTCLKEVDEGNQGLRKRKYRDQDTI